MNLFCQFLFSAVCVHYAIFFVPEFHRSTRPFCVSSALSEKLLALQGNIRVYVRIRPYTAADAAADERVTKRLREICSPAHSVSIIIFNVSYFIDRGDCTMLGLYLRPGVCVCVFSGLHDFLLAFTRVFSIFIFFIFASTLPSTLPSSPLSSPPSSSPSP